MHQCEYLKDRFHANVRMCWEKSLRWLACLVGLTPFLGPVTIFNSADRMRALLRYRNTIVCETIRLALEIHFLWEWGLWEKTMHKRTFLSVRACFTVKYFSVQAPGQTKEE